MTGTPGSGRVALVTGASRGIGAAVAVRLAELGMTVVVTARTVGRGDAKVAGSLEETVESVQAIGGRAFAVSADLADEAARERLVAEALELAGPIDVLVNNAAAAIYEPLRTMPTRRYRLLLELNAVAPLHLAQLTVPQMITRGGGTIVNISSGVVAHDVGPPFDASALGTTKVAYGSSKAALERSTTGLAAELYGSAIAVNAVSPASGVWTDGLAAVAGSKLASLKDSFETPEQFAEAVAYLTLVDPDVCTGGLHVSTELLADLAEDSRTGAPEWLKTNWEHRS